MSNLENPAGPESMLPVSDDNFNRAFPSPSEWVSVPEVEQAGPIVEAVLAQAQSDRLKGSQGKVVSIEKKEVKSKKDAVEDS